jgi:cupin fold WbuC family metalloprotein
MRFAWSAILKKFTNTMLAELSRQARQSLRLRANHNLHEALSDPVQRLAIAMEPETLVRPHRHLHTWEMLLPLRGRFVVLCFDNTGTVISRTLLGEDCAVVELPAGTWHAVLSLDSGGVIFEVKHGPYDPQTASDFAHWCAADADARQLNVWYAQAQVGDRLQ